MNVTARTPFEIFRRCMHGWRLQLGICKLSFSVTSPGGIVPRLGRSVSGSRRWICAQPSGRLMYIYICAYGNSGHWFCSETRLSTSASSRKMTTHNDVSTLQSNRLGAKSELDQIETVVANDNKVELDPIEQNPSDVVVSAYADLTTKETVVKFKRLFIIGFLVSFSGVYLGFTLTVPGSIVANQGKSTQFCLLDTDQETNWLITRLCQPIRNGHRCSRQA